MYWVNRALNDVKPFYIEHITCRFADSLTIGYNTAVLEILELPSEFYHDLVYFICKTFRFCGEIFAIKNMYTNYPEFGRMAPRLFIKACVYKRYKIVDYLYEKYGNFNISVFWLLKNCTRQSVKYLQENCDYDFSSFECFKYAFAHSEINVIDFLYSESGYTFKIDNDYLKRVLDYRSDKLCFSCLVEKLRVFGCFED